MVAKLPSSSLPFSIGRNPFSSFPKSSVCVLPSKKPRNLKSPPNNPRELHQRVLLRKTRQYDMSDDRQRRRSRSTSQPTPSPSPHTPSPSQHTPSPGAGPSNFVPDQRTPVQIVPKSAGGLQFQPTQFVLDISRNSYISRMSGAWPHWDSIPPHIKNAILADVLAVVRVEEHDMNTFLDIWNTKMRKNYRETISRAKTGGKKPSWMSDDVWAAFQQYWQTEKAKEVASRNKANREKNPGLHRGGSKSFQDHRRELHAKIGREPSMAEVFRRTHAVEHTDEEGNVTYEWADSKSAGVMERYYTESTRVLQASGQEELTVAQSDRIWDSIIKPPSRNRRYGYGNQEATQSAFRRSMEEETIARMQEQMNEMMDWRKTQMQHDVDERIAAYLQEYGFMPGQGGDATSEGGEDDDDDEAAED